MEFNFDDLKKDFDALKATKIKEENCDIACSEDEVQEEGFIETVQKYMLAPAKCGVSFSRLDIKVIGLKFGEDVQVRERKRMLRDILRAVTSKEQLATLFEIINETANEKIAIYDELAEHFPHSKEIFATKREANEKFRKVLEQILADFEGVEELF